MDANRFEVAQEESLGQPSLTSVSPLKSRPSLSLVLPAFNEQEVISQAIREADEALAGITDDYEILVVDDGCTDQTAEIVEREMTVRPSVRLLRQPANLGYGAALARGFRESSKDLVSFTDSDCQFDLNELERLVMLSRSYDVVCGYRIDRQDPWMRKVYSSVYNTIVRTLLGTRVRDCDCAMKVFRRAAIQNVSIETKGFFVNSEVLTKMRLQNCSLVEVGVTHRPRAAGTSTVSPLHIIPVVGSILRFWWNTVLFPQPAAETTSGATRWRLAHELIALLMLLVVCCAVLLPNLSYPLIEPDESRYAQIAMEMIDSGNWVTPTLSGVPYLDKPPLLYWLTAASMSMFGQNETAARLPCVLSAVLTVLATFWLGKRLVGSNAALCASVLLLLCGGFVLAGRFVIMDSLLTLFTTVSLLSGYLAVAQGRLRWSWWIVAAVACGLGVLTKGPVAIVLGVPPILAVQWFSGERHRVRTLGWLSFAGFAVMLSLPWFVAVTGENSDFVRYFFWKHNLVRFASGFIHQQPWWFYLPVLLVGMFPASMLVLALGAFLFSRSETLRNYRGKDLGFLMIGSVWVIGFFSLSSCKLATYILPAIPLLALMLGNMLEYCVYRPEFGNRLSLYLQPFPKRASAIMIGLCGITAAVVMTIKSEDRWLPITVVIVNCLAGCVVALTWNRKIASSHSGWSFFALIGVASIAFTFGEVLPLISATRSAHANAAQLLRKDSSLPVVYFDQPIYGATIYMPKSNLHWFASDERDKFQAFMELNSNAIVVTSHYTFGITQEILATKSEITRAEGGRNHVHLITPRSEINTRVATVGETSPR